MRRFLRIALPATLLALAGAQAPAQAATDNYLKISGIHGESTDAVAVNQIKLSEWSWSVSRVGRRARIESHLAAVERQIAAQAAQARAYSAPSGAGAPSGGWAIPAAIVMCESGGQNLPPNSAGASGYYQILPSTWQGEGGSGPAAYLAPKAEQDRVAGALWAGGAGAHNWVCAGIVG